MPRWSFVIPRRSSADVISKGRLVAEGSSICCPSLQCPLFKVKVSTRMVYKSRETLSYPICYSLPCYVSYLALQILGLNVQSLSEWNSRRVHVFFSEIIKKNYSKRQFQIFYQGHVRLTEFRYKRFVTRRLRILIPEYDQSDGPKNSNLNRTWLWRWPYNGEKKTTVI